MSHSLRYSTTLKNIMELYAAACFVAAVTFKHAYPVDSVCLHGYGLGDWTLIYCGKGNPMCYLYIGQAMEMVNPPREIEMDLLDKMWDK